MSKARGGGSGIAVSQGEVTSIASQGDSPPLIDQTSISSTGAWANTPLTLSANERLLVVQWTLRSTTRPTTGRITPVVWDATTTPGTTILARGASIPASSIAPAAADNGNAYNLQVTYDAGASPVPIAVGLLVEGIDHAVYALGPSGAVADSYQSNALPVTSWTTETDSQFRTILYGTA